MTCESFNEIIHELSTGRPVDGPGGRQALDHAAQCSSCSEALENQRRVTALLGLVAETDAELEAPERIEATLIGAFRLAHGTANVVPIQPLTAVPAVRPRRYSNQWMAAAAAIVIGVAATLVTWQAVRSQPVKVEAPEAGPVATKPSTRTEDPRQPAPPRADPELIDRPYGTTGPGRGNPSGPIIPVSNNAGSRRPASRPAPAALAPESQELVTDFYSLVPASGFAPTEGGQLVRLEVPRASLATLGVPIPVGNADGSVTADLVMGYDGVAHAIRFVQPNTTDERRTR